MSDEEKEFENEFIRMLATSFLREKITKFPFPWKIEYDWTAEIIDAKGNTVYDMPVNMQRFATKFIVEAEKLKQETDESDRKLKEMYPDMDFDKEGK